MVSRQPYIVLIENYQKLNQPPTTLSEALMMSLIEDLNLSRDRDTGRDINFD